LRVEICVMKFNLEDRLIKFSVDVFGFTEKLPDTKINNHLCGQLIRSASAPALMYAEANAAESPSDFIHKMAMALKELRESNTNLRMFEAKGGVDDSVTLKRLIDESRQLILIFGASINTAKKKLNP
jgi:four helix bundle protein